MTALNPSETNLLTTVRTFELYVESLAFTRPQKNKLEITKPQYSVHVYDPFEPFLMCLNK